MALSYERAEVFRFLGSPDKEGAFAIGDLKVIASIHEPLEANKQVFFPRGIVKHTLVAVPAWEHVSVSRKNTCPSWGDMAVVKNLFWEPEDTVIQFHPPQSEYINDHEYALHMWRPLGVEIQRPPSWYVGTGAGQQATREIAREIKRQTEG